MFSGVPAYIIRSGDPLFIKGGGAVGQSPASLAARRPGFNIKSLLLVYKALSFVGIVRPCSLGIVL